MITLDHRPQRFKDMAVRTEADGLYRLIKKHFEYPQQLKIAHKELNKALLDLQALYS